MDAAVIARELEKQIGKVVGLLTEGCHHAKLETATLELVAWFELWLGECPRNACTRPPSTL